MKFGSWTFDATQVIVELENDVINEINFYGSLKKRLYNSIKTI